MASSITRSAMRGAATLIMAISSCAALLPTLSIMSAAFRQSSRVISMSMRASAMRCSHTECSASFLPKATRDRSRLDIFSSATSAAPMRAHAMMDAAGPEAALGDLEAAALAEQEVADRHAHVLKQHLGVAVRRVVIAEHRQHAHDLHAGRIERNQDLRLLVVPRARPGRSCP